MKQWRQNPSACRKHKAKCLECSHILSELFIMLQGWPFSYPPFFNSWVGPYRDDPHAAKKKKKPKDASIPKFYQLLCCACVDPTRINQDWETAQLQLPRSTFLIYAKQSHSIPQSCDQNLSPDLHFPAQHSICSPFFGGSITWAGRIILMIQASYLF